MNVERSQSTRESGPPPAYDPLVDPAGLGTRTVGSDSVTGELYDVLRLRRDLGRPTLVATMLRERAAQLAGGDLAGVAKVVRVQCALADGTVEVISRRAEGFRLSAVLEWAEARGVDPSLEAALTIGDWLLAALCAVQERDTGGASGHGAIAIDQVVVNEAGRLTLTDYAFGSLLAGLQWPREQLWRRFRIAMPPAAGLSRFDHRVDVTQAAVVICALLAGRRFGPDEYPRDIEAIVAEAVHRSCGAAGREDFSRLGTWLRGAAEVDSRSAFPSAGAARRALRDVLGHRLDDTEAVRRWLQAAGCVAETAPPALVHQEVVLQEPVPTAAEEPRPTAEPAVPASDVSGSSRAGLPLISRLRQWVSGR